MAYAQNDYGGSNVPDWARDDDITQPPRPSRSAYETNPFDSAGPTQTSAAPSTYNRDRDGSPAPSDTAYRTAPEDTSVKVRSASVAEGEILKQPEEEAPKESFGGVYVVETGIPSLFGGPARLDGNDKRWFQRLFPRICLKSLTTFFVIAELAYFIIILSYGSSLKDGPFASENKSGGPGVVTFYKLGASFGVAVEHGQVWRMITTLFLHTGFLHILPNCVFGFLYFGYTLEARWGKTMMTFLFLLGGASGVLWSCTMRPLVLSVGGGILQLFGADIAYLVWNYPDVKGATVELIIILLNAIFNMAIAAADKVDYALYIGATVNGALLGAIFLPKITDRGEPLKKRMTIIASILFFVNWLVLGLILWLGKPHYNAWEYEYLEML